MNGSIDGNAITVPDGTSCTVCDFVSDSGMSQQRMDKASGVSGAGVLSIFAKRGAYDYIAIRPSTSISAWQNFNLNTGTVASSFGTIDDAGIENWGDGWYRCWIYKATNITTVGFYALDTDNITNLQSNSGDNSTVSVYFWGAQSEQGQRNRSSYIPTVASTVARQQDRLAFSSTDNANATVGSVVVEFTAPEFDTDQVACELGDGTANERITVLGSANSGEGEVVVVDGGVTQATVTGTTQLGDEAEHRVSGTYEENDIELYADGLSEGTPDAAATLPAFDTIYIGHSGATGGEQIDGVIHRVRIYKEKDVRV